MRIIAGVILAVLLATLLVNADSEEQRNAWFLWSEKVGTYQRVSKIYVDGRCYVWFESTPSINAVAMQVEATGCGTVSRR